MKSVAEIIPYALYEDLSKRLINLILGTKDKNAVPSDLAKKIIYLWQHDQLASPTGITALLEAAIRVDAKATYSSLEMLGLEEAVFTLKMIQ